MAIMIMITAANEEEASKISRALDKDKLIACANRFPVNSIYRWQGMVYDEQEVMLVCKTKDELLDKVIARVKKMHSYDIPEIIAIPIVGGSQDYLDWLDESTSE